jgi:ABC-type Fe3+ transport system permease subunit
MRLSHTLEYLTTITSIAIGIAVSAAFALRGSWFLSNLLFYWVPQACVLSLFCLNKPPRPAVFAGAALALAAHLGLFGAWLFSRQPPESMAWLGYLFSLPGAVVGSFLALGWLARRKEHRPVVIGVEVGVAALAGIAANQAVVCSTVMYCGGK